MEDTHIRKVTINLRPERFVYEKWKTLNLLIPNFLENIPEWVSLKIFIQDPNLILKVFYYIKYMEASSSGLTAAEDYL